MKKFTLLFAMLIGIFSSTWAQTYLGTIDWSYSTDAGVVKTPLNAAYLTAGQKIAFARKGNPSKLLTIDNAGVIYSGSYQCFNQYESGKSVFTVGGSADAWTFESVHAGYYFPKLTSESWINYSIDNTTPAPTFKFVDTGDGDNSYFIQNIEGTKWFDGNNTSFTAWKGSGDNAKYYIYEANPSEELTDVNPTPLGTEENGQYQYTSPFIEGSASLTKIRLTFKATNTGNTESKNHPFVHLAEFYLYDKDGNQIDLTPYSDIFSSNATETQEGSLATLNDGVTSGSSSKFDWYWHSSWSAGISGHHYLEINVSNIDADLSQFKFGYVTRNTNCVASGIIVTTAEVPMITYQIMDGDNVIWHKTVEGAVGEAYPECQVNPWVSVVAPEGTVSVSETKVVDYVSSIKTFNNVADVDQWYTLDIHGNESNYVLRNEEGNIRVVNKGSDTSYRSGEVKAKYGWAFIGNPITGVKIYNNEAEKFVVQPSDGDVEIVFGDDGSLFQVCPTTSGIANSFALKVDGRSYYINHRQPKIQGWTAADAGSSFRAWAIDGIMQFADLTALNAALVNLNNKIFGAELGQYHEITDGAVAAALQTASQFNETTPASEQAAVDAAAEALNNAAVINLPTAGSYIRFKGYSGNYIDGATTGQAKMVALEGNENTTIFLLNTESQIISVTTGTGFENTHTIIAESEKTPHVFTITEGSVIGTYQIRSNYSGSQIWYDNTANGKKLDRNGSPATQTNWTIEAAPVAKMRITSAQWATFCAPFAVAIPEGVKAYTGEMQDGWIRMNELSNGIIPANTGVVINAEAEVETLLAEIPDNNETVENNCYKCNLTGRNMTVEVGDYLLQKQNDVVGWYKVEGEGFKLAPNRCYLAKGSVPEPNQSRTFFGFAPDDATGINSIATEAKTKADGKYMVNGQIVVVKAGKAYNMSGAEIK
jgi:hypothetical protein